MLTSVPPGLFNQVYSTLPTALGFQLGDIAQVANSDKFVMLVVNHDQSAANGGGGGGSTITANEALQWNTTASHSNVPFYGVDALAASATTECVGVNDMAGAGSNAYPASIGGASITAGQYFWMTVRGWCYPLVAASTTAGAVVGPGTGAAGTLQATTPGTTSQSGSIVCVAGTASGSAAAALCYKG
jgi:hypothetical protein